MNLPSRDRPIARVAWFTLALCAHTFASTNSAPIRIGLLLPPEEAETQSLRQGAEIAIARANRSLPGSVELIVRGRPGQWGDDGVEAGRLVLDDRVSGLIAPPGGAATHLALQIAGRTATPVVSLCPDDSVTGAGVPWAVRIVPGTIDEARTIMQHFSATHGRWVALVQPDRSGREVALDLSKAAAAAGCQLDSVAIDPFKEPSTLASALSRPWPDGFLIWLDANSTALAARHLSAEGFKGTLAGPGRLQSAKFSEADRDALEGILVAGYKAEPGSMCLAALFERDYLQATGVAPDLAAAFACDAAALILHFNSQSKSGAMHRLFPLAGTMAGVTGTLQFDQRGNRVAELELNQFQEGRWTTTLSRSPGAESPSR